MKLFPYLQWIIDIPEHKHVCKHTFHELPRNLVGYSLLDWVYPELAVSNEITCNACFLKSLVRNAIHCFEVIIPSSNRNIEKNEVKPLMVIMANLYQPWNSPSFFLSMSFVSLSVLTPGMYGYDVHIKNIPQRYVFLVTVKPPCQLCIPLGYG